MTMDAFSNPAARIGFGTLDLLQATEYPMTRMTQNYQLLTSLYRENWIIQNIISTIPNDMMRKWYDLRTSVAPEYLKQMTQLERRTQIRKKLLLGMCWGRLYGGAVGVILIKGHNDMSQPLNLDTIMPGLAANDFGDSIRFGASTAEEDEKDLNKVHFNIELYRIYVKGYLEMAKDVLTPAENASLPWGARLMTLECGMRFLADFLQGDVYFKTTYPEHNLVRARTQFRLVKEMEEQFDQMQEIVETF